MVAHGRTRLGWSPFSSPAPSTCWTGALARRRGRSSRAGRLSRLHLRPCERSGALPGAPHDMRLHEYARRVAAGAHGRGAGRLSHHELCASAGRGPGTGVQGRLARATGAHRPVGRGSPPGTYGTGFRDLRSGILTWITVLQRIAHVWPKRTSRRPESCRRRGSSSSLEGGRGCGKSTLMESLAQRIEELGHTVLRTREPGGTPVGERIRAVVLDARHQGLNALGRTVSDAGVACTGGERADPPRARSRAEVVLCDRFADASVAYQGVGRELGFEECGSSTVLPPVGCSPPSPSCSTWTRKGRGAARAGSRTGWSGGTRASTTRVRAGYHRSPRPNPSRVNGARRRWILRLKCLEERLACSWHMTGCESSCLSPPARNLMGYARRPVASILLDLEPELQLRDSGVSLPAPGVEAGALHPAEDTLP